MDASRAQVDALNVLARFLAYDNWAGNPVDALLLLGNSVLETARCAAELMKLECARNLLIAGGVGHQTKKLEARIDASSYGAVETADRSEASMLAQIVRSLGVPASRIILEDRSTNTGENARFSLRMFAEIGLAPDSMVVLQDPTMLRRAEATFRHVWRGAPTQLFSHAAFVPELRTINGSLVIESQGLQGIWTPQEFVSLILGEIPRLRNHENGYGPKGFGYIAAVEIPAFVEAAYLIVAESWPELARN